MVEEIRAENIIFAIIIRAGFKKEGIEFFTPNHFSQQVGYMSRPMGYEIEPHTHKKVERKVTLTQEVLFVKSGRVRIDIFDNTPSFLQTCIVSTGDIILLANGGHALKMLEDSEIIEIKQGPYGGDADKIRFTLEKTKSNEEEGIV